MQVPISGAALKKHSSKASEAAVEGLEALPELTDKKFPHSLDTASG
jgi:hypothetical protein